VSFAEQGKGDANFQRDLNAVAGSALFSSAIGGGARANALSIDPFACRQ